MNVKPLCAWAATLTLGFVFSSSSVNAQLSFSVLQLPEGNEIIQVTDAVANNNPGGQATADTRTVYTFEPDFGDPFPNDPDFPGDGTGGAWPWVYAPADAELSDLMIDPAITGDFGLITNPDSPADLQWVTIDGNPLYQFINDEDADDANGNFGPWNYVALDGSPTQSAIPEPSTYGAIAGLLGLALVAQRRLRRRRA
jgi:MYXO-CTERM domain-containing protein